MTTAKRAVRLHADDGGLSAEVCSAVAQLLAEDKLESVSVLVTHPYFDEFCDLLAQYPQVAVYLHANLNEGSPVLPVDQVASLVTKNGRFSGIRGITLRAMRGSMKPTEVRAELEAQLRKLQARHTNVVGIDSHQHAHALSPIAEVVYDLAHDYKLANVRSYAVMRTPTMKGRIKLLLYRLAARVSYWQYNKTNGLPKSWREASSDPFVMATWDNLNHQAIPAGCVVAFHPGTPYDYPFTMPGL